MKEEERKEGMNERGNEGRKKGWREEARKE